MRRRWQPVSARCAAERRCFVCTTLRCSRRPSPSTLGSEAQRERRRAGRAPAPVMYASLKELVGGLTVATVATTLVDVALIYYLIYRLLLTIRGTRAAQMIVGIVLVGAAFFIAERLELSTVSWLLDNFIA